MLTSELLLGALAVAGASALVASPPPSSISSSSNLTRRDQGQPNTQVIVGTCGGRPVQIVYSDLGNSFSVRLDGLNLETFATSSSWGKQHLNASCAVDIPIAVTPLHWAYLRNVTMKYSVRLQSDDSASYAVAGYMAGTKFTDVNETFKGPINPNDGNTDVRLDSTKFRMKRRLRSICGVNTHLKMFITSDLNIQRKIYGRDSRLELMSIDGQLDQVACTEDGSDSAEDGFDSGKAGGHVPSEETLESSIAPILSAVNNADGQQNYFYSDPAGSTPLTNNEQNSTKPATPAKPSTPSQGLPNPSPQSSSPSPNTNSPPSGPSPQQPQQPSSNPQNIDTPPLPQSQPNLPASNPQLPLPQSSQSPTNPESPGPSSLASEEIAGSPTELPAPPLKPDHHFSVSTHHYTGSGYSHSYYSSSSLTEAQLINDYPIFQNSMDHTFFVSGTSLKNYLPPLPAPPGTTSSGLGSSQIPTDPYPFPRKVKSKTGGGFTWPKPQFTDIVPYDNKNGLQPLAPKPVPYSNAPTYYNAPAFTPTYTPNYTPAYSPGLAYPQPLQAWSSGPVWAATPS